MMMMTTMNGDEVKCDVIQIIQYIVGSTVGRSEQVAEILDRNEWLEHVGLVTED